MKYLFNYLMKKLVYIYAPGDPPADPSRDAGSQVKRGMDDGPLPEDIEYPDQKY